MNTQKINSKFFFSVFRMEKQILLYLPSFVIVKRNTNNILMRHTSVRFSHNIWEKLEITSEFSL